MAVTITNTTNDTFTSSSTPGLTVTAPTDGRTLVLISSVEGGGATVSSITQTGATWQQAVIKTSSDNQLEIWYANNVASAGTSVTVNLSGSVTGNLWYGELIGVSIIAPLTDTSTNNGTGINTLTGTVTGSSGDAFVAVGGHADGTGIIPLPATIANSFIQPGSGNISGDGNLRTFVIFANAPTANEGDFDWDSSVDWTAAIASFLEGNPDDVSIAGPITATSTLSATATVTGYEDVELVSLFDRKSTYKTEALANFIFQFKNSTKLQELACTYLDEVQTLDTVYNDIIDRLNIDLALSDQLDIIGRIVDEDRAGRADGAYRTGIRIRIRTNASQATTEDIIGIVSSALNNAGTITVTDVPPAHFFVTITDITVDATTGTIIRQAVQDAKPAGVGFDIIGIPDPLTAFKLDALGDGTANGSTTTGQGLDEGEFIGSV